MNARDHRVLVAKRFEEIREVVGSGEYVQFPSAPGGKISLNGKFNSAGLRIMADSLDEINASAESARSHSTADAAAVLRRG